MRNLRTIVIIIALFSSLFVWFVFAWFAIVPNKTTEFYAKSGVITSIDYSTNTVTFVDRQGNEWQFENTDDWAVNDLIACTMSNNKTDNIYDDVIINVTYEG